MTRIDSHRWARQMRLPSFTPAAFRKLKLGETLDIVHVQGPPKWFGGPRGSANAAIRKDRGALVFFADWSLSVGPRWERRPDLRIDGLEFKLERGNRILTRTADAAAWRDARRILHRLHWLARWASVANFREEAWALDPLNMASAPKFVRKTTYAHWLELLTMYPEGQERPWPVVASATDPERPWRWGVRIEN